MSEIDIGTAADMRQKVHDATICGLLLTDHDFNHVKFTGVIVAVLCSRCGRYPLEIMARWAVAKGERAH